MRIVTISTIEPGSNSGGVALIQIVIDEETGGRVINNGIDLENTKALMVYIGELGKSLGEAN